jgi:4-hydroxy-4-methyl-2-oxoglutarate aldolase
MAIGTGEDLMQSSSNHERTVSTEVLNALRSYDSATISNVIELFKIRPNIAGYMNGSIRAQYPKLPPIVGYSSTATFRSAYPSAEPNVYRRLAEHIERIEELPEPRIVVVQDLDEPPAAAALGEVMGRLYKRFGCDGFITNGGTRDILQVEKLDFAVFASSAIVSHGYPHLEEIHVPVHVGGLVVRLGDLLHADANGVVSIPNHMAELVSEACGEFSSIEDSVLKYLAGENVTSRGYRDLWEKTKKQFEELSTNVRQRLP